MGYALALAAPCGLLGPASSPADGPPSPLAAPEQVEAGTDAPSSCADGERRKTVRVSIH